MGKELSCGKENLIVTLLKTLLPQLVKANTAATVIPGLALGLIFRTTSLPWLCQ